MPKLIYMSTSYNKVINATTIVQCAAACKWLQPGSGLVDAFLTGLVDACVNLPRDAHIPLANRRVANYRAHRRRASVYEGNPRAKQIKVAKTEAVQLP